MRSGGTGAPPDAMPARASRGSDASRGDSSSWRSTVGTIDVLVMRSCTSRSIATSTSHLYIVTSLLPITVVT